MRVFGPHNLVVNDLQHEIGYLVGVNECHKRIYVGCF